MNDLRKRIAACADFSAEERALLLDCLPVKEDAILHAPPNYLGRIESLYAVLSLDDGGEGVCAAPLGNSGITAPLIGADKVRFDTYLRPMAKELVKTFQRPIRVAKFTKREDLEILRP